VNLDSVQRQIDESLQSRLNSSVSDNQAATTSETLLGQVESTFNALSGNDLSSQLSTFFNSWSSLANNPHDTGARQTVVQDGQNVAQYFQSLDGQLTDLQTSTNSQITTLAKTADGLADQIAQLNGQITTAEGGTGGTANSLRDSRDAAVQKLSQLVNITTVNDGTNENIYVGSDALVTGTTNRGITTNQTEANGHVTESLAFKADNGSMNVTSGQIGAMISVNSQINDTVDQVNSLANNLTFELNKVYSSGQGLNGFSSVTSTNAVTDPTAELDTAAAGLTNMPVNGSFVVHLTNQTTGLSTSTLVKVDADGLNDDDTSLNSLAADLNGINGVSATVNGGKLTVATTNSGDQISFSQDSSGVLASLGINNFFTGTDASSIAVNQTVVNDPTLLAAAKNGQSDDNQTALAIANLQSQPLAGLDGSTLNDSYESVVNNVSNAAAAAKTNAEATQTVQDTLTAQRESLSGVDLNEEAVNMMTQQRAFQGAARLITTVNTLMDEVMALIPE
jgi:flagellar hook-associated protein 1